MSISQQIQLAISEALNKDETLSKSVLYTKLSEVLKITPEEVKTLLTGELFTDEQKKAIAETLGTTTEALTPPSMDTCPTGEHPDASGKCVPDSSLLNQNSESKKLKEALDDKFGQTNDVTKKLDEIKKLIETNSKDEETKKFMNEIVRQIIETIPLVASSSPKFDEIDTIKAEIISIKEQNAKSTLSQNKLDLALNEAKALTIRAEKQLTEMQKGGKGLHEPSNDKSKNNGIIGKSFGELGLSEMISRN